MPAIHVSLDAPLADSFRVAQVAGMFGLPSRCSLGHTLCAELPSIHEPWSIGAIVGPSGSGKTTLARAAFASARFTSDQWPTDRPLIAALETDGNDEPARQATHSSHPTPTIKQLARVLCGVGLGSIPTWLKPAQLLSTGERFRATLARGLLQTKELLVCDEFTSALDRTLAKTTAAAVSRLTRSSSQQLPRLVVLTCHDDVLPWLAPDWLLSLGDSTARLSRPLWNTPQWELTVRRVPQSAWSRFAALHYLGDGLAKSATCYGAFLPAPEPTAGGEQRERLVGFCAVVSTLGWRHTKHITRLVMRPEFQGLGLGARLLKAVATITALRGNRVTITTSHPAIVDHCQRAAHWRATGIKRLGSTGQQFAERAIRSSAGRAVASFEFLAH